MSRRPVLAVGALLVVVALGACSPSERDDTTRDADGVVQEGGELGVFAMQVGDCFDEPDLAAVDEEGEADVASVAAVPCSEPHDFQVFATFDVDDADEFPGVEAMVEQAETGCLAQFEGFVGTPYEESAYFISFLYPSADTWGTGDREVVCSLTGDGEKITGDARDSGA